MFKELYPLIQNRALTITVAAIGDGKVRVNVVPQSLDSDNKVNEKVGYSHKDKIAKIPESAIAALTTPLSLVGTPEEIDGEFRSRWRSSQNHTFSCRRRSRTRRSRSP
jgi:PRTRC genetic system protein E